MKPLSGDKEESSGTFYPDDSSISAKSGTMIPVWPVLLAESASLAWRISSPGLSGMHWLRFAGEPAELMQSDDQWGSRLPTLPQRAEIWLTKSPARRFSRGENNFQKCHFNARSRDQCSVQCCMPPVANGGKLPIFRIWHPVIISDIMSACVIGSPWKRWTNRFSHRSCRRELPTITRKAWQAGHGRLSNKPFSMDPDSTQVMTNLFEQPGSQQGTIHFAFADCNYIKSTAHILKAGRLPRKDWAILIDQPSI